MRTLTSHLRHAGDHGRLAFHPDCPVCREQRLAGALPPDNVIPARAGALLAAGVLTLSTVGPTVTVAAGQTQEEQGAATPAPPGNQDTADDPDFDPGGDSTQLPDTPQPAQQVQAPAAASNGASVPVDQEPRSDADAPIVDGGDGAPDDAATPAAPAAVAPTPAAATPSASPAPASPAPTTTPEPTSTPAPSATPAPTATPTPTVRNSSPRREPRHTHRQRTAHRPVAEAPPAQPAAAPRTTSAEPVKAVSATTRAAGASVAVQPGDRTHVVRSGESLWSIASELIGGKGSPAAIARTVNRLWELNHARIGTGNPNLVMPGTELVLP
jgi:hypothetical protein